MVARHGAATPVRGHRLLKGGNIPAPRPGPRLPWNQCPLRFAASLTNVGQSKNRFEVFSHKNVITLCCSPFTQDTKQTYVPFDVAFELCEHSIDCRFL